MSSFSPRPLKSKVEASSKAWLITGVSGFIGSNLLEALLRMNRSVVGLDNFSTGHRRNLSEVSTLVTREQWDRFQLIEGDICDFSCCQEACRGISYVLHQAALGSVSRSIDNPILTNKNNIDGFLNMLVAARDNGIERFVYAASSSSYGNNPELPRVEERIGSPLSPYALTKLVNEMYASVFGRTYGMRTLGLRYFNVFGKRQDPHSAYAAVIPKWISAMIKGEPVLINGDGETSRDFCYIENAIQANLLAATACDDSAMNQVYNVAVGERTTLNQLYLLVRGVLTAHRPNTKVMDPIYTDFRAGDVRHSLADIGKAQRLLGYTPTHRLADGLHDAIKWYLDFLSQTG